ncbi:universal stress protein [soil metagenome]
MSAPGDERPRLGTVLVPTDFSAEAEKAIVYAQALLREAEGTLHLVYVHENDYIYAMPTVLAHPPVPMTEELEQAEALDLKELAARCHAGGAPAHAHTKTGRAFDGICQTAAEIGADLIMISTHGNTGLKHLFLGSTTERVVQHAPCPVLVVREQEREFIATDPEAPSVHIAKILVPVDFSDCSRSGLQYALQFAQAHGASVVLLHVVQLVPFMPSERFGMYEQMPGPEVLETAAREQMAKVEQETDFGDVPREARVVIGRAADEICRGAEQFRADLVIIPTHGRTGLAHVLIGSTAEHVVRYAPCPVLVVPHRENRRS